MNDKREWMVINTVTRTRYLDSATLADADAYVVKHAQPNMAVWLCPLEGPLMADGLYFEWPKRISPELREELSPDVGYRVRRPR